MATANFDIAAGVSQSAANKLLIDFYTHQPKTNNPFKNSVQKQVKNLGTVTLTWSFDVQPAMLFGPPSQENWNNALDSTGQTNQAANHALPSAPMIQLIAPSFSASYVLNNDQPVGGTTKNLQIYGTLGWTDVPSPHSIAASMVAALLDESDFKPWDVGIFNDVLIPVIFQEAATILQPVQIPGINWNGVTLNPNWDICISGNADAQVVAAATLAGNPNPLSISGISWPTDAGFCLASNVVLKEAAALFASTIDGLKFGDDDQPFKDLATWSFDSSFQNCVITPDTMNPITFTTSADLNSTASAQISDGGLASTVKACPLTTWFGKGNSGDQDDGITVTYDVDYKPTHLSVTIQATLTDSSLSIKATGTNFESFSLTPDTDNQSLLDSTITTVVTPIANLVAGHYQGKVKDKILSAQKKDIAVNVKIAIGNNYSVQASKLSLGDAQMPFGDTLKVTCELALVQGA